MTANKWELTPAEASTLQRQWGQLPVATRWHHLGIVLSDAHPTVRWASRAEWERFDVGAQIGLAEEVAERGIRRPVLILRTGERPRLVDLVVDGVQ